MIPVSREISDLKAEFEGGSSFSVDWYVLLRKGAESVLDNINPETLKRTVPIYGGLTRNLKVYYCPADVEVPSRLYSNDRKLTFDYMPPAQFYAPNKPQFNYYRDYFTIEYVNGVRFIVVRHPMSGTALTVDPMDDSTDFTGDVTLTENTYNILPGASVSLQGTFTNSAYTITKVMDAAIDISSLLRGVVIMPLYIDNASDILSVELDLMTDNSNYYTVSSTQDSVGDYIKDGQNMVRFWLNSKVLTGAPTPANITKFSARIRMKTGKTQTVILGKITVQQNELFQLEYYSNQMFVDGTTGAWKSTPAAGDQINLNRDAMGILHYETARLTVQAASFSKVDGGAEKKSFDTELARKYQQYFASHPSSEQPLSYSIMPDVAMTLNIDDDYGDFADRVGENTPAIQGSDQFVRFVDNETPDGTPNGVLTTFTLDHSPVPPQSLELTLNGQLQIFGVDYTLASNVITFVVPPPGGVYLIAYYRYNA